MIEQYPLIKTGELRKLRANNECPPRSLNDRALKSRLCDLGPGYCQQCQLCEFGKEILRREQLKAKGA